MHVILLLGGSTAGKSSLCKQLVAKFNWFSNSYDEAGARVTLQHFAAVKPFLFEELNKYNLTNILQVLMTDDDIQNLASMGRLKITKGNYKLICSFPSPELEGLEERLKKSGFTEHNIPELAKNLRLTTKIGGIIYQDHPFPDPVEKLYDETFSRNNSGKTIVLDVIPNQNSTAEACIDYFKNRAKQYKEQNPSEPLEISIVFAYCPPQKLSERIQERNRQAELKDPMDKREGIFPFEQLATLVSADKNPDLTSSQVLSRTDLFSYVQRYAKTEKAGDPIFLENPVDQDIRISHIPNVLTTTHNNAVKIINQSDADQSPLIDSPRIGTKKTIDEYARLARRFGLFEEQEKTSLNIKAGLSFDAVIDTSKGTPDVLAIELVEQLDKNKSASKRITKL